MKCGQCGEELYWATREEYQEMISNHGPGKCGEYYCGNCDLMVLVDHHGRCLTCQGATHAVHH